MKPKKLYRNQNILIGLYAGSLKTLVFALVIFTASCGSYTNPNVTNGDTSDSSDKTACTNLPTCDVGSCGVDPVCGQNCGECPSDQICANGNCQFKDPCHGACSTNGFCTIDGECITNCVPNCTNLVCGPDTVCNVSCGVCDENTICSTDQTQCIDITEIFDSPSF